MSYPEHACALTLMRLMHELEQFVDHGLQELPMRFQKSRVLAHDVHYIGCADSLVVLATLHLCEAEEILDDGDEETLFHLFA